MLIKSEKQHLTRLRSGEMASFRWVYDVYHEKVFNFCYRLSNDKQVAEEITEDVFVRVWLKRQIIDPNLPLQHLLLKITKDFVWNHLKKQSRVNRHKEQYASEHGEAAIPSVEGNLIFKDYIDITEAAIEQLPEKRRMVFNLRYKTGWDNNEIAAHLNISEATVRVHLSKATQFLRKYLNGHPEITFFLCAGCALFNAI